MYTFLYKTTLFILIPLLIILISFIAYLRINTLFEKEYKLDTNISEIFIGDCHIRSSIDDRLVIGAKNLGQNAESYYFSYYKLRLILESNPNIQRVYLGFSYHNLSSFYHGYIKGPYSDIVTPKFLKILPFKEQIKLVKWNPKDFLPFLKAVIKTGLYYLIGDNINTFVGGYLNTFRDMSAEQSSMDGRLRLLFYTNGQVNNFSALNIHCLEKIIRICQNAGVDLVLFSTPLHPYFYSKIPVAHINKYNCIINTYKLKVIDFSTLLLGDDNFTPDGDHVSEKGSLKLTEEFLKIRYKCTRHTNFINNQLMDAQSNFPQLDLSVVEW